MLTRVLTGLCIASLGLFSLIAPSAADPAKIVRIASIGYFDHGQLRVGGNQSSVLENKGWLADTLKKRGVMLQWVPIPSGLGGPGFNEALVSGKADFASYGDFPAVIAKANNIPIKLIVPAGRGTNSYLVVRPDSPFHSIRDLKGKTIALQRGRPPELAFSQLIAANGLKPEDFHIYNIEANAGVSALVAGRVDALIANANAYDLEDKHVGRIIWSSKGTNWKWRAELFVHTPFADANPELTQLVVNAYVAAAYWESQDAHRDETIQLISRTGTPLSVVTRDYQDSIPWKQLWSPLFDGYMVEHYNDAIKFAKRENLIRQDFPASALFDEHYVPVALKQLNLQDYWSDRPGAGKS